MSAKLKTPIEVIKKASVFLTDYDIKNIFINIDSDPYIRVTYNRLDSLGNVIDTVDVNLNDEDFNDFMFTNKATYILVKRLAYLVGQSTGTIPTDAIVT